MQIESFCNGDPVLAELNCLHKLAEFISTNFKLN